MTALPIGQQASIRKTMNEADSLLFAGTLIPAGSGTRLTGNNAVALTPSFHRPIFSGATVTTAAEAVKFREDEQIAAPRTLVLNDAGGQAAEGEAVVLQLDTAALGRRDP